MEKEVEKELNIMIMEKYYMKGYFLMEKKMGKEKNIMKMVN